MNKSTRIRILILTACLLLIMQCAGNSQEDFSRTRKSENQINKMDINLLVDGTEIRNSGLQLMNAPLGIIELGQEGQVNDSALVIAVHGYQSRGYEWVSGLKHLADYYGSVFFFRYDWEECPELIAQELATKIQSLNKSRSFKEIIVFGHSYGGIVVTFLAGELGNLNTEINVIAAPLSGYPLLLDACSTLSYDENDKLIYPKWKPAVQVIQHKTVHVQDGAFRELASDPQEVDLPFARIQELPPTMDGHRLGHNWSVSWVLDQHVGKPHRY